MNGYIEQKIIELQNSKTATEITQNAKYFINILAENERLTKLLENSVQLPCKVGDTVYVPYSTVQGKWEGVKRGLIRHIGKSKNYDWGINIDFELSFTESFYYPQLTMLHLVSSLNKTWFKTKPEAEARLKEL